MTGLTNYTRYTVMLDAMLEDTPILTDTIKITPTAILRFLPLVKR